MAIVLYYFGNGGKFVVVLNEGGFKATFTHGVGYQHG
jgi:hypothetical protein